MKSGAANVTGLSPKEGPPGTAVTIRGENLGQSQADLLGLRICGTDCLVSARWESSHKILARVGAAKGGPGDVIVYTKSGGKGSCSVSFRVFTKKVEATDESAVWVEESVALSGRLLSPSSTSAAADPLTIADRPPSAENAALAASMHQLFPDGNGNIKLEGFVPAWFLLQNHQSATIEDLRKGLDAMKKRSRIAEGGPKELIKSNLYSFLACVDALANLNRELSKIKVSPKGFPPTKNLQSLLETSGERGEEVFRGVLRRLEDSDATRSVLSILHRYRFLFFLPDNIRKNLSQGDYGVVVSEVERVKSVYGDSEVPLFREALAEVAAEMKIFQRTLQERLCETTTSIEDQKKIVRHLSRLDASRDVGWSCISSNHVFIESQLWEAQEKLFRAAQDETDGDWLTEEDKLGSMRWMRFVEGVSLDLGSRLREFWRLCQAYLNGQLGMQPSEDKRESITKKINSTINLASWLMLNAILPSAVPKEVMEFYSQRLVKWRHSGGRETGELLSSLRLIRSLVARLRAEELPSGSLDPLRELSLTLRVSALRRVLGDATADIVALEGKETWKLETKEADLSKTQLPDLMEARILDSFGAVEEILHHDAFPGEESLFHKPDRATTTVTAFKKLLCVFKSVLEALVRLGGGGGARPSSLELDDAPRRPAEVGVKDKKILIALANCDYVRRHSLPNILNRLSKAGLHGTSSILKHVEKEYSQLSTTLTHAYVSVKTAPLPSFLQFAMGNVTTGKLEGVSNGVKDALLVVVGVEAELFLHTPHFAAVVGAAVVKCLLEGALAAIPAPLPSSLAASQALVDLGMLSESLDSHMDAESGAAVRLARHKLLATADVKLSNGVLNEERDRMRLSLLGLQGNAESASV